MSNLLSHAQILSSCPASLGSHTSGRWSASIGRASLVRAEHDLFHFPRTTEEPAYKARAQDVLGEGPGGKFRWGPSPSVCVLGCVRLFATLWTVAGQAPLSMGLSRQEYRSGLPFPSLGDLPYLGSKSVSLKSPAMAHRFFTTSTTWEALIDIEGGMRRG